MANRKNWLGILVIVLVFGMMVVGCDDDSTDDGSSGVDPALNGTWVNSSVFVDEDGNVLQTIEYTFNNGNYEFVYVYNGTRMPYGKGTYTTSGNKITITITHFYGSRISESLESKWYTKAELKASGTEMGNIDEAFAPHTLPYSISGNTFTFTESQTYTNEEGITETYTFTITCTKK